MGYSAGPQREVNNRMPLVPRARIHRDLQPLGGWGQLNIQLKLRSAMRDLFRYSGDDSFYVTTPGKERAY